MKKYLFIIFLILFNINVYADENPTLYFFFSTGCSHCTDAIESLNEIVGTYEDDFNLVIYDISAESNSELYYYAVEYFDLSNYVPLFVVGEYSSIGYTEEVLTEAYSAGSDTDYNDVLIDMIEKNSDSYIAYTLEEACEVKGITYNDTSDSSENNEEVFEENIEVNDSEEDVDLTEEESLSEQEEDSFNYRTTILVIILICSFAYLLFKKEN